MKIAVNKAHFPVTVLGPGRRIGIWLQGCSIRCKGCISQDTWEADPNREMEIEQLLDWCRQVAQNGFNGVTISGGEPFDQPQALSELLDELIQWRSRSGLDFDILCYSGYPLATLQSRHPGILAKLDALIPEPYADALPLGGVWRGSLNQKLVMLSARGRRRYTQFVDAPPHAIGKRIQASVEQGRVWYIGIPDRGDMETLEKRCAEQGVRFADVSWRQ